MISKRTLIGGVGVLLIAWSTGVIDPDVIDVPVWWRLVALGAFLTLAGAWIGAGKINDLLPDDEGTYLVELDDTRLGGGRIWELNDEQWQDLTVAGSLHQWDESTKDVYEVREYDPELNRAIGNWRETKPSSAIMAEKTVEDALAAVAELRRVYEQEAAEAKALKRQLRGTVRELDRERAKAQDQLLDEHVAPSVGDSPTISEVLEDQLPDDHHPEAMKESDDKEPAAPHPEQDEISFDVLDGGGEALATDGGKDE